MAPPEAAQERPQSLPSRKRGVDGALTTQPMSASRPRRCATRRRRRCSRRQPARMPPGSASCLPHSPAPAHLRGQRGCRRVHAYPRCTGALSYPFSTPLHSSLRWIGANEYECRHRQLRERLWIDRRPTEDSQATLEAFAMLPAARVGGDVPLIDAGGGLAAGRGRVSRLPRMTPQSSSNIFKGHKPAFRWQADFAAGVTGGRQG